MLASTVIDCLEPEDFQRKNCVPSWRKRLSSLGINMMTDNRIFASRDLGPTLKKPSSVPEPLFHRIPLSEKDQRWRLRSRNIRAWHYTRLTTAEVEDSQTEGIHLSMPATLRARLDFSVASDVLSA